MGLIEGFVDNLGLISLTAISVALTIYLIYSMVHPERL